MRIAIHQPNFIPWIGYFYKMSRCDKFVLLDDIQFEKNGYTNRNKIKTSNGPLWLTIPIKIKNHLSETIREIKIENAGDWKKKHIKTLEMNYSRSPFYKEVLIFLKESYSNEWEYLFDINLFLINRVRSYIGIKTPTILSSSLGISSTGTDRLVDIVKRLNGSVYVSGSGGSNYQDELKFNSGGINLEYLNFEHPVYSQLWGNFEANLSIIDYLFNSSDMSVFSY